jgi:hypothetical protein
LGFFRRGLESHGCELWLYWCLCRDWSDYRRGLEIHSYIHQLGWLLVSIEECIENLSNCYLGTIRTDAAEYFFPIWLCRFSTQFFYSQEIFDILIDGGNSASVTGQYVTDWMNAYLSIQDRPLNTTVCDGFNPIAVIPGFESLVPLCEFFSTYDFSLASFVEDMLNASSNAFGDPGFVDRKASFDNRVPALQNTDLYIESTLSSNTRVLDESGATLVTYLGPSGSDSVYSVPLAMQYAIKDTYTFFKYAVEEKALPLVARTSVAAATFLFDDWVNFYLFPPSADGNILTSVPGATMVGEIRPPFNGEPRVVQIAAASSAAAADLGGASPTVLAQRLSTVSFGISISPLLPDALKPSFLALVDQAANTAYTIPGLEDLGVCSQWPETCTKRDARLMDGGFTDGPSMAMNIGQYQTVDNGDLGRFMKIIFTNHNYFADSNVKFLSYFETPFNKDVAPGEFIWADGPQATPWRSPQIFEEELDDSTMLDAFRPIEGTNFTTAVYYATTIDNPAFGVRAGQQVQILLLQINSYIPVFIFGPEETVQFTAPMADMAESIAGSTELQNRILEFLEIPRAPAVSKSTTSQAPSASPTAESSAVLLLRPMLFSFLVATVGLLLLV